MLASVMPSSGYFSSTFSFGVPSHVLRYLFTLGVALLLSSLLMLADI